MNDADFESEKQRVSEVFSRWAKILALESWELTIEYCRSELPKPPGMADSTTPAMSVNASWAYLQAYITVALPIIKEHYSNEELEEAIVHELTHALVDELAECNAKDKLQHEERVVTLLARSLVRSYNYGRASALVEAEDVGDGPKGTVAVSDSDGGDQRGLGGAGQGEEGARGGAEEALTL